MMQYYSTHEIWVKFLILESDPNRRKLQQKVNRIKFLKKAKF
jgi:hypothetical protein